MADTIKQMIVHVKDQDGNFVPVGYGGNMNTVYYDSNNDGSVNQADKVSNTLTIVADDNTYVYDGSNPVQLIVATKASVDALLSEIEAAKKLCSDGKQLLANAITAKGIETSGDASFEVMASNIAKL